MVNSEIRNIISKFVEVVLAKGIRVEKVFLYGSYASGKAHAWSDIDIAIVSPDFGKDRFEEGKLLLQLAWRIDPRIEPVPVSLKSYKNNTWVPLIFEIRQHGIELNVA
jgi:predicted nucleotidyltransferase